MPFLRRQKNRAATPTTTPAGAPTALTRYSIPARQVPQHVAIVMDGNGRWAKQRGLPRTEGHRQGEAVVMEALEAAIEVGVKHLSLYAFSTENWKRSPSEVNFLMNFSRDVIHRRRDRMHELGVRVHWVGRRSMLWRSVLEELRIAEELTKDNTVIHLYMCVNYGGRAELGDAAAKLARDVRDGVIDAEDVNEKTFGRYMYRPQMPDVDLMIRPSGERRTSNFLPWQSWYSELVFQDVLWPDFTRDAFWRACLEYAARDRRYGGAVPNEVEVAAPRQEQAGTADTGSQEAATADTAPEEASTADTGPETVNTAG